LYVVFHMLEFRPTEPTDQRRRGGLLVRLFSNHSGLRLKPSVLFYLSSPSDTLTCVLYGYSILTSLFACLG
jgi:hypothetical protein